MIIYSIYSNHYALVMYLCWIFLYMLYCHCCLRIMSFIVLLLPLPIMGLARILWMRHLRMCLHRNLCRYSRLDLSYYMQYWKNYHLRYCLYFMVKMYHCSMFLLLGLDLIASIMIEILMLPVEELQLLWKSGLLILELLLTRILLSSYLLHY